VVAADGPAGLVVAVALALAARMALRRKGPRLAFDRAMLSLPVAGSLAREAMAARFARTLGTLVQNGVALIPALSIVREVLGNEAGVQAVDRATPSRACFRPG
jgi:general secretion pathway protein F